MKIAFLLLLVAVATVRAEIDYSDIYGATYDSGMLVHQEYFGLQGNAPAAPTAISGNWQPLQVHTLQDTSHVSSSLSTLQYNRNALDSIIIGGVAGKLDEILLPLQTLPSSLGTVTSWNFGQMQFGDTSFPLAIDLSPQSAMGGAVGIFRLAILVGLSIAWVFLMAHTVRDYM